MFPGSPRSSGAVNSIDRRRLASASFLNFRRAIGSSARHRCVETCSEKVAVYYRVGISAGWPIVGSITSHFRGELRLLITDFIAVPKPTKPEQSFPTGRSLPAFPWTARAILAAFLISVRIGFTQRRFFCSRRWRSDRATGTGSCGKATAGNRRSLSWRGRTGGLTVMPR